MMRTTRACAVLGLLAALTAGCTDNRLPEEKAADELGVKLHDALRLEERRTAARRKQRVLQASYDARIAELRAKANGAP